jgi:hypothetical protein
MTIDACLTDKAAEGLIDRKKAEVIARQFRENAEELAKEGRMTQAQADRIVGQRLEQDAERATLRKKRNALYQAAIQQDILADVAEAEARGIKVDVALSSRLSEDPRQRVTNGTDLASRTRTVIGDLEKEFVDFLKTFRSTKAGLSRDLTDLKPAMRELHGEDTGNVSAKAIAGGVKRALKRGFDRFNAAGGDLVEREDFGFFIRHDQGLVAAASREDWMAFVIDELDHTKMVDSFGNPMTRKQIWAGLGDAYDSIATGGLSDMNRPMGPNTFRSSVNARAQHRFLAFKNADAWIRYHEKFGRGSLYDHIVSSLHALGRDIATLEVLGPHPEATMRFMEEQMDRAAARGALSKTGVAASKAAALIGGPKHSIRALYDTVTGRTSQSASGPIAAISQGNRNVMISASLLSAWISALADTPLMALTARQNGMDATKTVAKHMKMFATNSTADRELAIRLGFTAQGWASRAMGAQRVMGEITGPEFTEKMVDTTLRATFLSPWTESGRYAFQLEMLSHITGQVRKNFDQLDSATRGSFERHGIDADAWELIRNTEQWVDPESGAKFIRAEDVSAGEFGTPKFDAANKLQQAIFNETDFAVISATPRVRALLTGGAPAGSFWGEVMRNTALFKGFPVSIMHQHYSRLMAQAGPMKKAQYAAWLVLGMTSVGALSEQMNQIASGKDPINMDPATPEGRAFGVKALVRGGSGGLFADIVFRDANRWGGGVWEGLLGPVARQTGDAFKLTVGNAQEVLAGEDTNAGRELSRFIQQNTPGRSAWYAKLALERLVFDQLDHALDPRSRESARKVEQRAREDFKQKFFFKPGKLTPRRAPDLSKAFGG